MDGLLDFIKSPEGQGLLAAGFGGLANARRGAPLNTIGGAGLAGMQGYAGAQDRQMRIAEDAQIKQLREQQLQQAKFANDAANRDQQIRAMAAKFAIPASRSITPIEGATDGVNWNTKETPASFDTAGYVNAVSGIDPMKAIQIQQALVKESNFNKIDVDKFTPQSLAKYSQTRNYGDLVPRNKLEFVEGVGVDPYNPANAGRSIPNPNKPFSVSPTGEFVPNTPYQQYEKDKAAAGATKMALNVDTAPKSMAVEFGKDIAKTIGEGRDQAASANQTLYNVAQIRSGLDKAVLGPLADSRIKLSQVGEMLGVTGKDNTEKLINTRNVIQGLARQELAAAGQMAKQGQITEGERGILRRAESGMVSEFTKPELKMLVDVLEKTANYKLKVHENNMSRLASDKNLSGIAPYYQVPSMGTPPLPSSGGWGIKPVP